MLPIALVALAGLVALTVSAGAAQSEPQEGSAPTGTCVNPGNAQTDNDLRATCTETAGVGQTLIGGGFGLDGVVPAGASGIGFIVEIRGLVDNNNGNDRFNVALSGDGGTTYTAPQTSSNIEAQVAPDDVVTAPASNTCSNFGRPWTVSELSDANFRARLTTDVSADGQVLSVDDFDASVCYEGRVITKAAGGTASPGGSLGAWLTVDHRGLATSGDDWNSTGYQIDDGPEVCVDTPNNTSPGIDVESLSITAPATEGSYDLTLRAYSDNGCQVGASPAVTLADGIVVGIFGDSFRTLSTGTASDNTVGPTSGPTPPWSESGGGADDCARAQLGASPNLWLHPPAAET